MATACYSDAAGQPDKVVTSIVKLQQLSSSQLLQGFGSYRLHTVQRPQRLRRLQRLADAPLRTRRRPEAASASPGLGRAAMSYARAEYSTVHIL